MEYCHVRSVTTIPPPSTTSTTESSTTMIRHSTSTSDVSRPKPKGTKRKLMQHENAYTWYLRTQHYLRMNSKFIHPVDPPSAAWSFTKPFIPDNNLDTGSHSRATNLYQFPLESSNVSMMNGGGGTGISYIDAALSRHCSQMKNSVKSKTLINDENEHVDDSDDIELYDDGQNMLPVLHICGEVGKTWTIISLAARFVVATRPSAFRNNHKTHSNVLPQVFILDSKFDITARKLSYAIQSLLIKKLDSSWKEQGEDNNIYDTGFGEKYKALERNMNECIHRVHIATISDDIMGWMAILETLRFQLHRLQQDSDTCSYPSLVLWDGFLSEPSLSSSNEASKMEIIRQVELLLKECNIFMIVTTDGDHTYSRNQKKNYHQWNYHRRFISQSIHLHRNTTIIQSGGAEQIQQQHEYGATIQGMETSLPFTITSSGILS